MKILTKLQVHHSSFFSSPVVPIQALSIISLLVYNAFICRCTSYSSTSRHSLFQSDEDISEDSSFHSQFTLVLLRMLSHSSHLILPVQSLFLSNCSTVFLLSGP